MKRLTKLAVLAFAGLAGALAGLPAAAQAPYPARPIIMIVPFAPGGTSDVIARLVAEEMSKALGQQIINENVAGAGGSTALTRAARAAPDGYTIVLGNAGTNAATYSIYPDLSFTPASFQPVGLVAKTMPVIAVRKDFPAATLVDFVVAAKKEPGKISLGHAGVGSSNFLICKAFLNAADIEVTLVSFRGAGPALNDLLGGHIDGVCDAAPSVAGAIIAGQARGLVVGTSRRLDILPGVPHSTEAGLPTFQAEGWNAIFVPAGTPPDVVTRLNDALRQAVASEFLQKRFRELGSVPAAGEEFSPTYVVQLVNREVFKFRELLKN